ncbi:ABC transporter ATP-binding protein [Streptomyces sp. NPDC059455]|uniref:ABC transporter ATP-binding protein n=1 Tax=Streptomyces sp. NPDC059455 TaxID=3346837 RepID=UPI0036ACA983
MTESAVELVGLTKSYGSVVAVDSVTLQVQAGSRHALIGPNGAGKSTLFAMIAGTIRPTSGTVRFFGKDISEMGDHKRARLGMAKTFQHSSTFGSMTVLQNVVLAVERRHGSPHRLVGGHGAAVVERAASALERAGLAERAHDFASELAHGERRQLEVALGLALEPRLILFDEPTAGMSAAETERFVDLVAALPRELSVLIIEHDLDVVFALADRISVLHMGSVAADGDPESVRGSEVVQQVYLGSTASAASTVSGEEAR